MFSIICSFFLPAVAQNADACAFWKLTFNRDFRSTEFQEIKINSCPALAASWGQCLPWGMLRTTEIFGWRSSSNLRGCAPLPHTIFLWQPRPTAAFPFLIKLFQLISWLLAEFLQISYSLWSHTRVHWTASELFLGPTLQLQTSHPIPSLTGWQNETTTPSPASPGPRCWNEEDFNRNVSSSSPGCN